MKSQHMTMRSINFQRCLRPFLGKTANVPKFKTIALLASVSRGSEIKIRGAISRQTRRLRVYKISPTAPFMFAEQHG